MDAFKFRHLQPVTDLPEVKIARRATPTTLYDDSATFIQDDTWISDLVAAVEESKKPDGGDAHDHAGAAPIVSGLVMRGPTAHDDHNGGVDVDQSETPTHAAVSPRVQAAISADEGPAAPTPEANEMPGGLQPQLEAAALDTVGLFESQVQQDPGQGDGPAIPLGPIDFEIVPPPPTYHIDEDNLHELIDHLNRHGEGEHHKWYANDLDGGTTVRVSLPQSWDQIPEELRILDGIDTPITAFIAGLDFFDEADQDFVEQAWQTWADLANVRFEFVEPGEVADIYFYGLNFANAYGPDWANSGGMGKR